MVAPVYVRAHKIYRALTFFVPRSIAPTFYKALLSIFMATITIEVKIFGVVLSHLETFVGEALVGVLSAFSSWKGRVRWEIRDPTTLASRVPHFMGGHPKCRS